MYTVLLSTEPTRESELNRRCKELADRITAWPRKNISPGQFDKIVRSLTPRRDVTPKTPTAVTLTLEQIAHRHRAYRAVKTAILFGQLPRPATLQCADGDHQAQEYDHHLGYEPEYYLSVEPVCRPCHQRRSAIRGQHKPKGTYGVQASSLEEAARIFDATQGALPSD